MLNDVSVIYFIVLIVNFFSDNIVSLFETFLTISTKVNYIKSNRKNNNFAFKWYQIHVVPFEKIVILIMLL